MPGPWGPHPAASGTRLQGHGRALLAGSGRQPRSREPQALICKPVVCGWWNINKLRVEFRASLFSGLWWQRPRVLTPAVLVFVKRMPGWGCCFGLKPLCKEVVRLRAACVRGPAGVRGVRSQGSCGSSSAPVSVLPVVSLEHGHAAPSCAAPQSAAPSLFSSVSNRHGEPPVKQERFARFTFTKVCKTLCAASDGCWCCYTGLFYFCTAWESCCDLLFSRLLENLQGLLAAFSPKWDFSASLMYWTYCSIKNIMTPRRFYIRFCMNSIMAQAQLLIRSCNPLLLALSVFGFYCFCNEGK